jgi:tRNA threonylcarbamoyl adenosine modification protein (Sua5/YciO/YrdC/YwlC family)
MLYDCTLLAERERGVASAIETVKRGDLVVLPTDTLYGLGADAFKPWAVTNLLSAKGSEGTAFPPVLVGSRRTIDELTGNLPRVVEDLIEAFWPGALTLVVTHSASPGWDVAKTGGTIAVRMPLHPVALAVLRETGPMAVSGANRLGQPAPRTAKEAQDQLRYAISVYLEAGPSPDSPPSTVVDVTGDIPRIVRPGAISGEQLRTVVADLADLEQS